MCSVRHGVAVAVLLASTDVVAQPSADVRARERRLDSMLAHGQRAVAVLRAWDDSVARTRARLDTVRVGGIRVLVTPLFRDLAERALRNAAARLDSMAGSAARRLSTTLVLRQLRDTSPHRAALTLVLRSGAELERQWGLVNDSTLRRWFDNELLAQLNERAPPAIRYWAGPLGPDTVTAISWLHVRLDLVSSDAVVARRCFAGDVAACSITLGLTPVSDPVLQWYDSTGRRRFVEAYLRRLGFRRSAAASAERCLEGSDAACTGAMRELVWSDRSGPATNEQRSTLARLAMQLGGPAAFDRILSTDVPIAELLAVTAQTSTDSLLRVWQARVRETRLPSQDVTWGIVGASLAWILACGALSLRSTRWR